MDQARREIPAQHSRTKVLRGFHWTLRDVWRSLAGGPGHRGPPSDHFNGERFFNPGGPSPKGFKDFLRWRRTARPAPWPVRVENDLDG